MKRFFLLFFVTLFLSCGIKQPVDTELEQQYGDIIVLSEPDGALIFLNGQDTALRTPDTLRQLPTGRHTVRTFLAEHLATPDSIVVQVELDTVKTIHFSMRKIETAGAIFIKSVPPGAAILVDKQPTGKITPDTLRLEGGEYVLDIRKNGYMPLSQQINLPRDTTIAVDASLSIQPCVLLEAFGNVSCTPCVEAAHNLETFVTQHPVQEFAIVEYYANWPSPNDPFYKEAPNDVMQRVMYYQLTSLPSMFVGGAIGVDATLYENINKAFTTAFETWDSPIGLSINKKNIDGLLTVDVETYLERPVTDLEDLKLYVAIVEDNISFDSPPGSNGLTHFNFVFRGFLPDKNGDLLVDGESHTFSYSRTWPAWNYANSRIIAFIQHHQTKHIIHTTIN